MTKKFKNLRPCDKTPEGSRSVFFWRERWDVSPNFALTRYVFSLLKKLRRVLPENPLNIDISTITVILPLQHEHHTYPNISGRTKYSSAKYASIKSCKCNHSNAIVSLENCHKRCPNNKHRKLAREMSSWKHISHFINSLSARARNAGESVDLPVAGATLCGDRAC